MGSVLDFSSVWSSLKLAPVLPYWLEKFIHKNIWGLMFSLGQFLSTYLISLGNITLYRFSNDCFLFHNILFVGTYSICLNFQMYWHEMDHIVILLTSSQDFRIYSDILFLFPIQVIDDFLIFFLISLVSGTPILSVILEKYILLWLSLLHIFFFFSFLISAFLLFPSDSSIWV